MQLTCEETFGPVAALFRFDTEDEAVDAANDTPFAAAYFYTQDVRRIARVSAKLETGIVGINEGALASEAAPFGGVKESGYGREGSRYGPTTTCRSSICVRAGWIDRTGACRPRGRPRAARPESMR